MGEDVSIPGVGDNGCTLPWQSSGCSHMLFSPQSLSTTSQSTQYAGTVYLLYERSSLIDHFIVSSLEFSRKYQGTNAHFACTSILPAHGIRTKSFKMGHLVGSHASRDLGIQDFGTYNVSGAEARFFALQRIFSWFAPNMKIPSIIVHSSEPSTFDSRYPLIWMSDFTGQTLQLKCKVSHPTRKTEYQLSRGARLKTA